MSTNYWSTTMSSRASRRRVLAAGGAFTAATAILAACGGDSEDSQEAEQPGLVRAAEDTSKQAKKGGTYVRSLAADIANLDPYIPGAVLTGIVPFTHNRLVALKPGPLGPADGTIAPDLAESWEWSGDALQLTMKLRQDARFHPIAPVNGRAVTMDDVLFSINRQMSTGAQRFQFNSVSPSGLILSATATDPRTLLIKLKAPMVYLLNMLATPTTGHLHILPKEAESGLDLRRQLVGSGPFMLRPEDYTPSVGFTFKRHPEYHDKERPYLDAVQYPIIPEYAATLAQFKTGAVHHYNAIRAEDMLPTKKDQPLISMYQTDMADISYIVCFGHQPGSIFNDERVRKAFSMGIDRDLFIDVNYNVEAFRKEGLPIDTGWSSSTFPIDIFKGWWLDPRGQDFGPNASFFKLDIAEAKKLLAAAGLANGATFSSNHFTTNELGPDYTRRIDMIEGMVAQAGFKAEKNIISYTDYGSAKYRDAKGQFEGVTYRRGPQPVSLDAAGWLSYHFHSQGDAFLGFDAAGKGDYSGDPALDSQIDKVIGELDDKKRLALTNEIQRYVAGKMYSVRWAGGASSFSLAWPAVQNFLAFRGGGVFGVPPFNVNEWLDPTQAPLKTS